MSEEQDKFNLADFVRIRAPGGKTSLGVYQVIDIDERGTYNDFPYQLSNGNWYAAHHLAPFEHLKSESPKPAPQMMPANPTKQAAWIVEGLTFYSEQEADDHIARIKLNDLMPDLHSSALSLILHNRKAILEILNGTD
jgi:hypothetical protein